MSLLTSFLISFGALSGAFQIVFGMSNFFQFDNPLTQNLLGGDDATEGNSLKILFQNESYLIVGTSGDGTSDNRGRVTLFEGFYDSSSNSRTALIFSTQIQFPGNGQSRFGRDLVGADFFHNGSMAVCIGAYLQGDLRFYTLNRNAAALNPVQHSIITQTTLIGTVATPPNLGISLDRHELPGNVERMYIGLSNSREIIIRDFAPDLSSFTNRPTIVASSFSQPSNDDFAGSLAVMDDINGDGEGDLDPLCSPGQVCSVGAVWVLFLNNDGSLNQTQKISALQGNFSVHEQLGIGSQFGRSVAAAGDLNGDGIPDFFAGAPGQNAVFLIFLNALGGVVSVFRIANFPEPFGMGGGVNAGTSLAVYFGSWTNSSNFQNTGYTLFVGAPRLTGPVSYTIHLPISGICGNGVLEGTEECDDGNFNDNDGCLDCVAQNGFICTATGCDPDCGDGVVLLAFGEECDDGNNANGDGCSAVCEIETGFNCQVGNSICTPLCGDSIVLGIEQCDDGNRDPGDGCDESCLTETSSSEDLAAIVAPVVIGVCCICCVLVVIGFCAYTKVQKDSAREQLILRAFTNSEIPILTDVEKGGVIGSGRFGVVYKGTWNGSPVAIKELKDPELEFTQELELIKEFRAPNIVQFYGVMIFNSSPAMVTEYMENGDLLSLLQKDAELTKANLLSFCLSCSHGMEYLHSRDVLHRDLAARNLLISAEKELKIADFGLSRKVADYYKSDSSKVVPVRWTSPEALEFNRYSQASDVWSFGIVVWEIFSRGAIPYAGYSNKKVTQKVKGGLRLAPPFEAPEEIVHLMDRCWKADAKERPLFPQITKMLQEIDISKSSEKEPTLTGDVVRHKTITNMRISDYVSPPEANHTEKKGLNTTRNSNSQERETLKSRLKELETMVSELQNQKSN